MARACVYAYRAELLHLFAQRLDGRGVRRERERGEREARILDGLCIAPQPAPRLRPPIERLMVHRRALDCERWVSISGPLGEWQQGRVGGAVA